MGIVICYSFFFIQFEIFLVLGMTSNFLLKCEYFEYYIKSVWTLFKPSLLVGFLWCHSDSSTASLLPSKDRNSVFSLSLHWHLVGRAPSYSWVSVTVSPSNVVSTHTSVVERNISVSLLLPEWLHLMPWGKYDNCVHTWWRLKCWISTGSPLNPL